MKKYFIIHCTLTIKKKILFRYCLQIRGHQKREKSIYLYTVFFFLVFCYNVMLYRCILQFLRDIMP